MGVLVLSPCLLTFTACAMFFASFVGGRNVLSGPVYTGPRLPGGAGVPRSRSNEYISLEITEVEGIRGLLGDDTRGMKTIGRRSLYRLMRAAEDLGMAEGRTAAMYKNLARASLGMIDINDTFAGSVEDPEIPDISPTSYLLLLRGYVGMHGACVGVEGDIATVCSAGDSRRGDVGAVSPVSAVRIEPSAFVLLVGSQEDGMRSTFTNLGIGAGKRADSWDAVIWILGHMGLTELDLGGCKMSARHVVSLAKLRRIKRLSLDCCGLQPNELVPVGAMGGLEELDVGGAGLSAKDISAVASLGGLRTLSAERCNLGATDLAPLGALPHLRELNVGGSDLKDGNIRAIALCRDLRILCMRECYLERTNLAPIEGLKQLESLDVGYAGLSTGNLQAIASLEKLVRLYMPGCDLQPDGLSALPRLAGLEELDVSHCPLSKSNAKAILALRKLRRLRMDECGLQRDYLLGIGELRNLEELRVAHGDLGGEVVRQILSLRTLVKLNMFKCTLEASHLLEIGNLENLEELDVGHVGLSRGHAEAILKLRGLARLGMEGCNLQPGDLLLIKELGSLGELNVMNNVLGREDATAVALCTKLRRLDIRSCHLKQDSFASIGRLACLEELRAGNNRLGSKDFLAISSLMGLRRLDLSCSDTVTVLGIFKWDLFTVSFVPISKLKGLIELNVSGHPLNKGEVSAIASIAKLTKLYLCNCKLDLSEIEPLGILQNLEILDLSGNKKLGREDVLKIVSARNLTV